MRKTSIKYLDMTLIGDVLVKDLCVIRRSGTLTVVGRSEGEKRKMMLLEWKRRNLRDATYQALVKELRAIENNATADQVEELERKRKLQGEK